MPVIYHITTAEAWKKAQEDGQYEATSLKEEGFIHCSEERQIAGVLDRYFIGKTDLVKLIIDTDKLTSRYVQEWSPSVQDTFPHIYGPINLDAVTGTETINP
ncbi:DUF952 domain-containing protein [Nostoc ellipsosporum NOK]|jgi:uncharacterized protein (DUF952 family)|nr:DUF952 domain-containing protein [Nostoc ellipsosporum NOK]